MLPVGSNNKQTVSLTCPVNSENQYITPDFVQNEAYIENFYNHLGLGNVNNNPNLYINKLISILSSYVCALANLSDLENDQDLVIYANAAILRLAQCYLILARKQKEDHQDADALASAQKALSLFQAFNQDQSYSSFTRASGSSSSAGLSEILQMARILPQTYQYAPTSAEVASLLSQTEGVIASLQGGVTSQSQVQLGQHFLDHPLEYHANQQPPFVCSCSAHEEFYFDDSVEAITAWAEYYTRQGASAADANRVIAKISRLLEMVRSCLNAPVNMQGNRLRPEAADVYPRILSSIARAYAKTGQYQNADNVFQALLGQGSLPSSLAISGLAVPTSPNNLNLMAERAWNLFNWAKNTSDISQRVELFDQVLAIAQSNNVPKKSEMITSVAWEFVNLGKDTTLSRNDRIAYLNRALQLTNNNLEFVQAVAWIFITMGGEDLLERAIQLSIQFGLTDNIVEVLSRRIDLAAGNTEQVLNYLKAMAAVLKATLSPVDRQSLTDGQDWSEIEASAVQLHINLSSLSFVANGQKLKNRLRLGGILDQISNLLMNQGQTGQPYSELSSNEYQACQAPLVDEIQGAHPTLDNFLSLASVYSDMGEVASRNNNQERAENCFFRALTIYRAFLFGTEGIDRNDQSFDAFQNVLLDINNGNNSVIARLLAKAATLTGGLTSSQRLEVLLGYVELSIKAEMKYTGNNLPEIIAARDRLRQLLNQVLNNAQANDTQKARAKAALYQINYALAEAYIRSGQPDQALPIFKENITGLLANYPTAEPYLGYAQISLLGNLLGLAWAYGEKANQPANTQAEIEAAVENHLLAASIYQALLYGEVPENIEISEILRAILPLREALLLRLSDVDNSLGNLHLTLAEHLKAAGRTHNEELLRAALAELDQVPPESPEGQIASVARAETQVALHICLANQGQIAEAATLIENAVTNAGSAYTSAPSFRSLSALGWALGVRGGFLESKGNIAEAHQDFARAAELYRGLLYDQAQAGLLEGQNLENLHITYADLLKAKSKGLTGQARLEALETAAAEYQQAPESLSARAGLAEVYVLLGEYYLGTDRTKSEQYYLEAMNLCEALLTAGTLPALIKDRAALLKSVTTLAWALNKLANLTRNLDYGRAALGIYRKLLNITGNHLPEIEDLELDEVLDFIIANRSALLSPEVLDEAQLNMSGLLMGYIGTLRSVKDFSLALSEAERLLFGVPAQPSLYDERFRLGLMRTIAEINLFDLQYYDEAEQVFEKILAEIASNQFGADDPEINGIRISALRGLADIHLADDEDTEAAIEDLNAALALTGDNPTGDNALQAARIHLTLASIYTSQEEDEERAREEIVIAQSLLLNPELSPTDTLPVRAEAYYALGEIARLIDENYPAAASQYEAALTLLEGSQEQDTIAQIHAALAFLRIAEQNFDAAESEVALAQASLNDDSSEGLIDMVDSAVESLRRGELSGTAYAQFGFAFQGNTFEGNDPQHNWPINFQLGTQLWQNLHLDLGYSYGPEHSTTYYDSASLEEMPRMSATGHHLNFGVTYDDEYDDFYFKVNPYFAFDIYDYTINGYTHTADYAHIIDTYENGGSYFAATQGLNGELFYKLPLELQLGLGAGLSVTERSGTLPSQAAEQQTAAEFPSVDAPKLEGDPFVSWYLHPQLRWNGFSLGFRAGDRAYDVSEQAFWPLENRDTMRYAATLGYNHLFTWDWGTNDKWFLDLGLYSEVGTHFYGSGSAGIGYVVSDDFIPQLIVNGSYFNDFSLDTESYNVGLGLRINFDLTPGSDD